MVSPAQKLWKLDYIFASPQIPNKCTSVRISDLLVKISVNLCDILMKMKFSEHLSLGIM